MNATTSTRSEKSELSGSRWTLEDFQFWAGNIRKPAMVLYAVCACLLIHEMRTDTLYIYIYTLLYMIYYDLILHAYII